MSKAFTIKNWYKYCDKNCMVCDKSYIYCIKKNQELLLLIKYAVS